MIDTILFSLFFLSLLILAMRVLRLVSDSRRTARLYALAEQDWAIAGVESIHDLDWEKSEKVLEAMSSSLGKAGFLSRGDRHRARVICSLLGGGTTILGSWFGGRAGNVSGACLGAFVGAYVGVLVCLYFLKYRRNDYHREVLFQLPLALESIILLVESGLGILPAIEKAVRDDCRGCRGNQVQRLLNLVYELSAHGVPFGQALEMVADATEIRALRHVLLHLDISGTEGGDLIPSLRSLAEHSHIEWKLSVETRVRRLENMVVFPVFASVIGLMLLTAAVPIVPLLELKERMKKPTSEQVFQYDSSLVRPAE